MVRRRTTEAPLSKSLRGLFLFGWTPERRAYGVDDPLRVYVLSEAQLRELWIVHRASLYHEAQQLGLERPWAATHFDGDAS
jgi:hypothetical protein